MLVVEFKCPVSCWGNSLQFIVCYEIFFFNQKQILDFFPKLSLPLLRWLYDFSYMFYCVYMLYVVAQSCPTLCDPMDCSPPGSVHGGSAGKNTAVGCHALLQGIFSTQGSNPGLPHCRWILYSFIIWWLTSFLE